MFSPMPSWKSGLQEGLDATKVYKPFRNFLKRLPMSQERLGKKVGKDRTTIGSWKSGELATLAQQRAVVRAVRDRLQEISQQADKVEEMIAVLEGVEAAHQRLSRKLDQQSLDGLTEANARVRDLLDATGR